MQLGALDDLDDPAAGIHGGKRRAWPLIAGIGEDFLDERPQRARAFIEHEACTVAVLNVGGMNCNAQQETKRVDEDVPLAPRNFLGAVKALRIEVGPPFGAPFTLWLSMMAAVGLASRPSISRTAT